MTAREKILDGIKEQAQNKADLIIEEALLKSQKDTELALKEANIEAEKIITEAQLKAKATVENASSSAQLLKRNILLGFKGEAINTVLTKVTEKLNAYKDKEYFEFLYSLAEKSALKKQGVLYLNEKDLTRDRQEFKENIKKLDLILSDEACDITGGFMLKYDDIIINCAFEALIHEKRERLTDIINKTLFS